MKPKGSPIGSASLRLLVPFLLIVGVLPVGASTGDPGCEAGATAVPPRVDGCLHSTLLPPPAGLPCTGLPLPNDRCPAWVDVYDHPGGHGTTGIDMAFDIAVSHDGRTAYVTGQSWDDVKNAYDFATIAYDAETGERRWLSRYDGPGDGHDIPQSLVLAPDGRRLYVTGWVHMNPVGEEADYATVAYDAETGGLLWEATYEGPMERDDSAYGVAVSPDGEWVYVTGRSGIQHGDMDFATIAYRAETGEEAWVARESSQPDGGQDIGISLVTSPDGETLYVTGSGGTTWMTVAYTAGDREDAGELLWAATYERGYAYWIALSPDGERLYVTGSMHKGSAGLIGLDWDYATIAYEAATGEELWMGTYDGETPGLDVPYDHALSDDGSRLYVTGRSAGAGNGQNGDVATVAFDTADGRLAWEARYETPGVLSEGGGGVAVAGDTVVVTGWSSHGSDAKGDLLALAYDAAGGSERWTARFNTMRSPQEQDFGTAVAATPDGARAFITGRAAYSMDPEDPLGLEPGRNRSDYITLAYDVEPN